MESISDSPTPMESETNQIGQFLETSRFLIFSGVSRLIANHPFLAIFESRPEVRVLSSAGITRPRRSYDPVRLSPDPPPRTVLTPRPPIERVSLDDPHHPSNVPCPLPRWTRRVHVSIASPSARPTPPPIARPSRSSATRSIDNSLGGIFLHR